MAYSRRHEPQKKVLVSRESQRVRPYCNTRQVFALAAVPALATIMAPSLHTLSPICSLHTRDTIHTRDMSSAMHWATRLTPSRIAARSASSSAPPNRAWNLSGCHKRRASCSARRATAPLAPGGSSTAFTSSVERLRVEAGVGGKSSGAVSGATRGHGMLTKLSRAGGRATPMLTCPGRWVGAGGLLTTDYPTTDY